MNKQRKTSHILNVFQYDADGHVVLPASLTLSIAPAAGDNNSKVPTTAWTRSYVSSLSYLTGNQTITVNGDASGSGTTSINLTLANTAVTPGVYGSTTLVPVVTVDSKGRITNVTTAAISGSLTFTGDVTGTGTTGTSTALTLANSGVTIGTYTKVTVDSKGRVTVGANATTSDISEGTRLYYTDARVLAYLGANNYATQSYVNTQVSNLVAAAPATLDTLNELAAALGNDASFSTTISTALGNRLRVDINNQGLSATLQGYGRTNLGLGTAATSNTGDFVAYRTFGTAANSAVGDFVAYRTFGTAANNNTGDFAAASHTHSIANVTGLQTALDGKQATLGGTGFVKSTSGTISYDTSTYLTTTAAAATYPTLTGGNASGTWAIDISGAANQVFGSTAAGSEKNLLYQGIADNDIFRLRVGGASNAGWVELATADDGTEPIYIRQYTGPFTTIARTATILDGSGNTSFPGTVTAPTFSGALSGNASTSTTAGSISGFNNPTTAATANTIVYRDGSGDITGRYLFGSYQNSSDDVNAGNITYIMAKFGDNYHRSATAAKVQAFLGLGTAAYQNTGAFLSSSGSVTVGGYLTVNGAGTSSSIYMTDSDEGQREIHCNSNRIGFLTQAGAWGAYCDDAGNWNAINFSGSSSGTNTGDQTSVAGNAGSVTYLPGRTDSAAYPVLWGAAYTNSIGTIAYSCDAITIQSSTGTLTATTFSGSLNGNATTATTATNALGIGLNGNGISGMGPISNWDSRPGVGFAGYGINNHTGVTISGYGGYGGVRLYSSGYPTHATSVLRLEASDSVKTFGGLYSDGNLVIAQGTSIGNSFGLNDFKLYLRGVNDNNHYLWNNASDFEEMVYYNGTGFKVTSSTGVATCLFESVLSSGMLFIGSTDASRTYIGDSSRSGISIGGTQYPQLMLNGVGGTNPTHGANISMTGTLSAGGFRRWVMGIPNYNPSVFSLGWADNQTNPHYNVGVGWSNPAIYSWDTSGNFIATGDITAYGTPSDLRLKTIKEKIPNAISSVLKLNGYRFDWIENKDKLFVLKEDIGVIAQEVADVFPELARTNEDGFMSVRYQGLTAVLIEAIKEQQVQIEELKNKLDSLIQN